MNFWETPDWIRLKSFVATTEKLLSRVEYLKLVGYKNFTDEKYKKYLKAMENKQRKT